MCRAYLSLFPPITLEWSPIIILYLIYKIRDTTAIQTDTIVCSRYKSRRNTLTLVYSAFVWSEEKIAVTKVIQSISEKHKLSQILIKTESAFCFE